MGVTSDPNISLWNILELSVVCCEMELALYKFIIIIIVIIII